MSYFFPSRKRSASWRPSNTTCFEAYRTNLIMPLPSHPPQSPLEVPACQCTILSGRLIPILLWTCPNLFPFSYTLPLCPLEFSLSSANFPSCVPMIFHLPAMTDFWLSLTVLSSGGYSLIHTLFLKDFN